MSGDTEGRASTGYQGTVRGGRPRGVRVSEGRASMGYQGTERGERPRGWGDSEGRASTGYWGHEVLFLGKGPKEKVPLCLWRVVRVCHRDATVKSWKASRFLLPLDGLLQK